MSEQTPDTESGMTDGQDPSMEDILASIRKIIAEDDVQAPAAPETVIAEVVADVPSSDLDVNPSGDVSALGHVETLDLDIITDDAPAVDADIDALIGDMDASVSDNIAQSVAPSSDLSTESLEDILDLEIPMEEAETLAEVEIPNVSAEIDLVETDALTLEDELIDLVAEPEQVVAETVVEPAIEDKPKTSFMDGAMAALGLGGAAAIGTAATAEPEPEVSADDEDELSLMLDNMLEDSESYKEASRDFAKDQVIDPAEALVAEEVTGEDLLAEIDFSEHAPEVVSKNDPDIDLVKSLMADLTEESLHDEAEIETETVDATADIAVPDVNDEADITADDIMDEILSVTIEDEAKLSEEISIPEPSPSPAEDVIGEGVSLKDIAAAAEADAQASESGLSAGLAAGLGASAIGGVTAVTALDEMAETEITEDTDIDVELSDLGELLADEEIAEEIDLTPEPITLETTTPESIIEETPEMARAKKTDAIIDEVTETATAGAFASLTNVVEDKAVRAERGDRIGDLVMEALQPMLKEWLDANLKGIVERAVTKEVKRISSGK